MKNKIKEHNNNEFTKFIETLSAHENSNYSLWKVTKKIKKPIKSVPAIRKADNTWARSNEEQAEEFSNHLCDTFTPDNINNSNLKYNTDEDAQTTSTSTDKQYTIPKTTAQEIRNIIEKTKKQQSTRNRPNQWQNLEKPSAKNDRTNDHNIQCNTKNPILF